MVSNTERAEKVVEMLDHHKTTMFVTRDKQGGLVSRPMTTQKPEFDGTIWFFVSSDADVIEEVEADPEVNVAYSLEDNFVSLSGKATMVDDDEKKRELWYPELKKWFDGAEPESSHVRLIKVAVDTARYWDTSNAGSKRDQSEQEGSPIDSGMVTY